jgi:hypothetical protein
MYQLSATILEWVLSVVLNDALVPLCRAAPGLSRKPIAIVEQVK